MKKLISIGVFLITTIGLVNAQFHELLETDSTNYYSDYSELLALRIYTNTKWNSLDIIRDDQKLSLVPNSPTSLGVGFNYKDYGDWHLPLDCQKVNPAIRNMERPNGWIYR